MCILALNIVIDKIYLILWFWFILVGVFGFIRICCRVVQIASKQVTEGNCIKIGLTGKLILSKRKCLREVLFS